MRWLPTTGNWAVKARWNWPRQSSKLPKSRRNFHFLYPLDLTIKEKIETIAREVYGADGVDYEPLAEERIAGYTRLGFDKLPICMAKTHLQPQP